MENAAEAKETTQEESSSTEKSWATLDQALLAAQRMARTVVKGKLNSFGGYMFASGEVLIDEGREYLLANGLTFVQRGQTSIDDKYVRIEYVLSHPASGEKWLWSNLVPAGESKGKPMDKALAGALTYDFGYTIRGLLLLPRKSKDELDPDERNDGKHVPAARPAPAPAGKGGSFFDDDAPQPSRKPYGK